MRKTVRKLFKDDGEDDGLARRCMHAKCAKQTLRLTQAAKKLKNDTSRQHSELEIECALCPAFGLKPKLTEQDLKDFVGGDDKLAGEIYKKSEKVAERWGRWLPDMVPREAVYEAIAALGVDNHSLLTDTIPSEDKLASKQSVEWCPEYFFGAFLDEITRVGSLYGSPEPETSNKKKESKKTTRTSKLLRSPSWKNLTRKIPTNMVVDENVADENAISASALQSAKPGQGFALQPGRGRVVVAAPAPSSCATRPRPSQRSPPRAR